MLGHLGFSYIGLIYLLMLWIPNSIWSKNKPIDHNPGQENKILLLFERVGQVCCTCSILIFSDFNIGAISAWSLWLTASFFLMILYEISWVRYFTNEHTVKNFYRSFYGIPVPGASLPVLLSPNLYPL
jgi:hypothetical protein